MPIHHPEQWRQRPSPIPGGVPCAKGPNDRKDSWENALCCTLRCFFSLSTDLFQPSEDCARYLGVPRIARLCCTDGGSQPETTWARYREIVAVHPLISCCVGVLAAVGLTGLQVPKGKIENKGKGYTVGPCLLFFFLFVVVGSSIFQILRVSGGWR